MSKNTILVTGGLGYIGSHTCVELLKNGNKVVVVDNLSNSNITIRDTIEKLGEKSISFYEVDVNNTEALEVIFAKEKPDGVIHFAAFKAVGESVEKPIAYYHNNIGGLISLLGVMQKYETKSLVFSSSCTVYGEAKELPVTEQSPILKAESPYGTTKIIGEEILVDYCRHKNMKVVSLRYFNPVGAHESGILGELPLGVPNNLIPFVTQTAAGIREKITVFGNDYDTVDGTCIRDYIHVSDLAMAHLKAIDYIEKEQKSYAYFNIGTGNGNTVLEVIKTFEKVNNLKLNYTIGARREGDVEKIWADTKKSNEVLGWETKYDLDAMMLHAWKWQQYLGEQGL